MVCGPMSSNSTSQSADENAGKSAGQRTGKRFCLLFLLLVTMGLSTVAAINLLVNPYGAYPTKLIPPVTKCGRQQKAEQLIELAKLYREPQGLILGSSRVMKIEPAYLQTAFGVDFYNMGVYSALPEDYLAMLRFYGDRFGHAPRYVVLGIDVYVFNQSLPTGERLKNCELLSPHISDFHSGSLPFDANNALFSVHQLHSSLRSLWLYVGDPYRGQDSYFRDDGVVLYESGDRDSKNDDEDEFRRKLEASKREYETRRFANFERLSEKRIAALDEFLELSSESDTQVIIFLTPLHPEVIQHLRKTSQYDERKNAVLTMLREHTRDYQIPVFDLTSLDSFGGFPGQFEDGAHPLEPNTREMIDMIVQSLAVHRN